MRCGLGCSGWTGLSKDETWSTWSPVPICLENIPDEEWTTKRKKQLFKELMDSEKTPENLRAYNKNVLKKFIKIGATENIALSPLAGINPRCGNCNYICVADPKKRNELWKLLKSSGTVHLDADGKEYVRRNIDGEEQIYYPPTAEDFFSKEELEYVPDDDGMNGFAAFLAKTFRPLNNRDKFIDYAKNLTVNILLATTDGFGAALVRINQGKIQVEAINTEQEVSSLKKGKDWNGMLLCPITTLTSISNKGIKPRIELLRLAIKGKAKIKGIRSLLVLKKTFGFANEPVEESIEN